MQNIRFFSVSLNIFSNLTIGKTLSVGDYFQSYKGSNKNVKAQNSYIILFIEHKG